MSLNLLRAALIADATVTGLVVERIFPVRAPQAATRPFIVMTMVSSNPEAELLDCAPTRRARWQVDCTADTYDGARALGVAVRAALDYYSASGGGESVLGVFLLSEGDFYDDDLECYVRSMDFDVIAR